MSTVPSSSSTSKRGRRRGGGGKKSAKTDDLFGSAGLSSDYTSPPPSSAKLTKKVKRTKVGCKPKPHQKTIYCQWYQSGECMRGENCFYLHEYDSSSCPMSYQDWKAMREKLDRDKKKRISVKQAESIRKQDEKLVIKTDRKQSTVPPKGGSVWNIDKSKSKDKNHSLQAKLASDQASRIPQAVPSEPIPAAASAFAAQGSAMYYSPYYSPFGPVSYPSPYPGYAYGSQSYPYYDPSQYYGYAMASAGQSSVPPTTDTPMASSGVAGQGGLNPSAAVFDPNQPMPAGILYPPRHAPPSVMMNDSIVMLNGTKEEEEYRDESDESDLYFQDENGEIVSFPKEEVYNEDEYKDFEYRRSYKKLARDYARNDDSGVQRVDVSAADSGGAVYGLADTSSAIPVTIARGIDGRSSRDTSPDTPTTTARDICPYFLNGTCRHSYGCRLVHQFPTASEGRCPCCLEIISLDPAEQRKHLSYSNKDGCPELKKMADERRESIKIECDVCYDRVLSKPNGRFGILPECDHHFCLDCIRNWRGTVSTTLTKETIRSCPVCRTNSWMVVPSDRIPMSKERKIRLIDQYTYALSIIDCKFYCRIIDKESGKFSRECPFGTSCLYRHRNEDGTLQDRKALPSGLLLCKEGDGRMRPDRDVLLSDVITDAFAHSSSP